MNPMNPFWEDFSMNGTVGAYLAYRGFENRNDAEFSEELTDTADIPEDNGYIDSHPIRSFYAQRYGEKLEEKRRREDHNEKMGR